MSVQFKINDPEAYRSCGELDVMQALLVVDASRIIELGCGAAWMTRQLVERLGAAQVTATEVDRIQHAKNLDIQDLPKVEFRLGGAEAIDALDASYDVALMLKSLHHVPVDRMDQALAEIHRVLVPGGALYVSEPVYWGPFNEVMRLIHDEREVRIAAFEAMRRAVDAVLFKLEHEIFYEAEGIYPDWDSFAGRFLHVTHTEHDLDAEQIARVRAAFERHLTPAGARFMKPHRVDLLRRIP
ncbi:class I SAM-dependent methyltransferase [Thiorhodococcus mannitoliphagus]|uniref:Class I SAM-dependent methyltransferase n=1 Tax=Thiorhodococcus mannitoliphagus TaxID=329406 RepID=A0A6P1DWW5_9GAMM|nr:class I SAM-dependent methyltransferase [Thiorhodococcus mannitoliphagus]NEX20622.1 class I SAM-dependent methyltransferase [Thiorhodococcus mannitoliphagus]